MGKKSKRRGGNATRSTTSSGPNDDNPTMKDYIRSKTRRFRDQETADAFKKIREMEQLSLEQQRRLIRTALEEIMETDVIQNDNDSFGNGDQNPIVSVRGRDAARELFAIGGDIHAHFTEGALSTFAMACLTGSVKTVFMTLERLKCEVPLLSWTQSSKVKSLLERRETSLRFSPLLLMIAAGKNIEHVPPEQHLEVARLLLKYGASPLVKDVFGKTACHYGAGGMATSTTLQIVDMCIRAAESCHMYGKSVELHDLQVDSMNGQVGFAGGFDEQTNRRYVFLPTLQKEVAIKVQNLRLVNSLSSDDTTTSSPVLVPLYNMQDRLGSISLHEVILKDHKEAAEFLLKNHHASIHIKDADGMSPLQLATNEGQLAFSVSKLILKVAREEGNATRKEAKKQAKECSACHATLLAQQGLECDGCNMAWYCNRTCRKQHWDDGGHTNECASLAKTSKGIRLDPPLDDHKFCSTMSFQAKQIRNQQFQPGSYCKPSTVDVDEFFVVKVQAAGNSTPILIYDETRTCQFTLSCGQPGYDEVLKEVQSEQAWEGRKTFMKASFDSDGNCIIYPRTAGVKSHYKW